jgi:ketosteroid isomerase-like protein
MNKPTHPDSNDEQVREVLDQWASTTRKGLLDEVLKNHTPNVVIFDVLPPMQYEGAAAYRQSWGDWQPETQGEGVFDLQDLRIVSGTDVAFAYGFIHCGGTLPNGKTFEDLVRATFCLQKIEGAWRVSHQHISKPFGPSKV